MDTVRNALGKDQARTALLAGRIGIAASTWLVPGLVGRLVGASPARNPGAPYLARLFGTRDAWLAVEVLRADGAERDALLAGHVWIDAADAVAALVALRRRSLPVPGALVAAGTAAFAVALGWRAARPA